MSDKSAIIKEAQKYLARGQIEKAIAEWEKLTSESPDGNTYNTIGDLYLKKGEKANAIDSYHKAAGYFRDEGFALKALALYKKILNLNQADAISLLALGELNEAKGIVTDAIKFYLAAADSYTKEGKKEKILEIYDKILNLSPGNIPLRNKVVEIYLRENLTQEAGKQYLQIAKLYNEKREMEKAIEYYQKSLNIDPVNKETILDLSAAYEKTDKRKQAAEQINEAAALFPQDTEVLLRAAEIHIGAELFDQARQYLAQIKELEPANVKARKLLGEVYTREGRKDLAWVEYLPVLDEMLLNENYDDAIKILGEFKDIDPVETGRRLISLYIQIGDYLQVVHELTALGTIYLEQEKPKEALNCFREALQMSPEDEALTQKVIELEKQVGKEQITVGPEKTVEEAIIETDIYLRYGLYENAREILKSFKEKEPGNIDIHTRLKTLFVDTGDKEQAVAECILLAELFEKAGDLENREQILKEAREISPEDPRLISLPAPDAREEEIGAGAPEEPSFEDYSEEVAEADFYARQGLIDEARAIFERLQTLFPENEEITQKLGSLGLTVKGEEQKEPLAEEKEEPFVTEEILEAESIAEPTLDNDVMDIFNEFKKGLEKELEDEDYETHYNLGIAYKEMGLIDDAIREFQASLKDPKRFVHSANMLGVCYLEKGLYPLAIDVLKNAIEKMEDRGESYWAMKYDLANAYEKNGDTKEAFELFMQVYGWNSKFRAVSDKIDHLKASMAEGAEQKKPKDRKDRVSYL
ncbi:MAG: tetratricopeptide repeat protein [Thermodesulfovibrionales bacterium]|nr:tetratricopeptide repeat protein [Thermodesulfovibrionales bacterium]